MAAIFPVKYASIQLNCYREYHHWLVNVPMQHILWMNEAQNVYCTWKDSLLQVVVVPNIQNTLETPVWPQTHVFTVGLR